MEHKKFCKLVAELASSIEDQACGCMGHSHTAERVKKNWHGEYDYLTDVLSSHKISSDEGSLVKSIAKWEDIVNNGGEDKGKKNCQLCGDFIEANCVHCIVRDYSGYAFCEGTPYEEWLEHQEVEHGLSKRVIQCDECKRLAMEELEFLKMLNYKEELDNG